MLLAEIFVWPGSSGKTALESWAPLLILKSLWESVLKSCCAAHAPCLKALSLQRHVACFSAVSGAMCRGLYAQAESSFGRGVKREWAAPVSEPKGGESSGKGGKNKSKDGKGKRCYNCDETGHFASERPRHKKIHH